MKPAGLMIGDFARRSRLPVSTLRYYDRIGLLRPAAVDPNTGYRRYTPDQLPAAVLISRLRSLRIPPDSIGRILAGGPDGSTAVARERQRITAEIELGRQRLRGLDELLAERPPDGHRVEIVELPAREVAAVPFLLPAADLASGVTRAIAGLRSALRRGGHRRAGLWGATFPLDLDEEVSGFVFAPVVAGRPLVDLDTAWLPATRAVAVVHSGNPGRLPLAYHAAFAVLAGFDALARGPVIEEYPELGGPGSVLVYVPFGERPPREAGADPCGPGGLA